MSMPALYKAITEERDAEKVARLLKEGADPNAAYYGLTALMEASRLGCKEMVAALLEAGADVHRTRSEDESAVLFAKEAQERAERSGRQADAAKFGEIVSLLEGHKKPARFSVSGEVHRAQQVGKTNPEEGLRILDDLLKAAPGAGTDGAFNQYGLLCMKIGDLSTARDAFERDIAARPGGDLRFSWLYLGLVVGLQGEERQAHEFAAKAGNLRIEHTFADTVREAHIAWIQRHGRTSSRLGSGAVTDSPSEQVTAGKKDVDIAQAPSPSSPAEVKCLVCGGQGKVACPLCHGRGKTAGFLGIGRKACPGCDGSGRDTCYECRGKGKITPVTSKHRPSEQRVSGAAVEDQMVDTIARRAASSTDLAERIIKTAQDTVPRASELFYYFICSGNQSLIKAYHDILRIGTPAYGGSASQYRAERSQLEARKANPTAASMHFAGQSFMGSEAKEVATVADVLARLMVSGDMLHISFAAVGSTGRGWVQKVYSELLVKATGQGILPFRMYTTPAKDAAQFLLDSFDLVSAS